MTLRLPRERPDRPPTGYKIAYPVLSRDGTRAGFTGVSLGGGTPYGVLGDARCVYGRRHRAPARRCDCGFHCLHSAAEAADLTCAGEHRRAVVLEVAVLGAYIRYERGMRYARQRVRRVRVGPCACGRTATRFADAEWGLPGWRVVAADCGECAVVRSGVPLGEFARLAGEGLVVAPEEGRRDGTGGSVHELIAEAALLQARLDWFQKELARLDGLRP
ncbi:hypothetical protein [Streptomyces huiliensis]|uniref:hypothetical protein n=1 Tax=Streptomyces huiliensis TaxID=2876027 RepID=UPI001CBD6B64|nr:hypothetical protein [Streptomyces huiliensis]MBZ4319673.1 hypothetical protein [Streptomyces huiliensis]